MPAQPLNHIYLQFTPAPRSISESRSIYRALRKFGEIDMFKVLRHDTTTKGLSPKAHLIYKKPSSGTTLIEASPLKVPPTRITLTGAESAFPHSVYIQQAFRGRAIRTSSSLNKRHVVAGEDGGDLGGAFRSDNIVEGVAGGSRAWGEVEKRLLKRYTGGFVGFDGMVEEERKGGQEARTEGGTEEDKA